MASGRKQEGSSTSKVILHIVDESGKGSEPPQPASENGKGEQKKNGKGHEQKKNGKGEQKTNGNKKKKGKGNGDVFRVQDNNINGGKADRCGVFGFGNKYYGRKKPKEDESSEEEGDSSDEDYE